MSSTLRKALNFALYWERTQANLDIPACFAAYLGASCDRDNCNSLIPMD